MRGPTGPFFDADDDRLRLYLGTYFPRTVIESWNIFTEVLAIPIIREAFARKERIRLLDIGSGTGGAVVGVLLAFQDSRIRPREVEVTPFDGNQGALDMQQEIMATLKGRLPFRLVSAPRYQRLPSDRAGFARALSAVAEEARPYDLITCWKCLCEFYNFNFSSAHGIIRSTLDIAARMLLPYGLCVVADVTTTDNNYESFAKTLNREANAHDTALDATARTVLPLPCGRSSGTCTEPACYTQRRFAVSHRLVRDDESKIAYRVLAPASFAKSVTASFTNVAAYRVNAARPAEACFSGRKRQVAGDIPSGYTDFFAVGE